MFNLFRKKSEIERLSDQYKLLLKEAYELSSWNRKLSDAKAAEAEEVLKKIEQLKSKENGG
jgi:prefoldin subunit 5